MSQDDIKDDSHEVWVEDSIFFAGSEIVLHNVGCMQVI